MLTVKRRHKTRTKPGNPLRLKDGRTLFPESVRDDWDRVLINAVNNTKIGSPVVKGG